MRNLRIPDVQYECPAMSVSCTFTSLSFYKASCKLLAGRFVYMPLQGAKRLANLPKLLRHRNSDCLARSAGHLRPTARLNFEHSEHQQCSKWTS